MSAQQMARACGAAHWVQASAFHGFKGLQVGYVEQRIAAAATPSCCRGVAVLEGDSLARVKLKVQKKGSSWDQVIAKGPSSSPSAMMRTHPSLRVAGFLNWL